MLRVRVRPLVPPPQLLLQLPQLLQLLQALHWQFTMGSQLLPTCHKIRITPPTAFRFKFSVVLVQPTGIVWQTILAGDFGFYAFSSVPWIIIITTPTAIIRTSARTRPRRICGFSAAIVSGIVIARTVTSIPYRNTASVFFVQVYATWARLHITTYRFAFTRATRAGSSAILCWHCLVSCCNSGFVSSVTTGRASTPISPIPITSLAVYNRFTSVADLYCIC